MATDIYELHKAAFAQTSAFVVLDDKGERVATVAIKFPRDGAGRLYAYVHVIGVEMVRSHANGYGYDKRSAAVSSAIAKIPAYERPGVRLVPDHESMRDKWAERVIATRDAFQKAAPAMDSDDWTRALEKAGFQVIQAV